MSQRNPALQSIYENLVRPEITKRKLPVEGSVMGVDYQNQTAVVYWRHPESGAEMQSKPLPIPVVGGGVLTRSVDMGDRVILGFRNGNEGEPHIISIEKLQDPTDFRTSKGSGIPKGMPFL